MTEDRKIAEAWLRRIETEPSSVHRDGWVVARCPLAPYRHGSGADKNPSFALRLEPGDSFTNCFACGWHGRASDLAVELMAFGAPGDLGHALREAEDWAAKAPLFAEPADPDKVAEPWPEWWLDGFPSVKVSAEGCAYLAKRHTPAEIIRRLDLRWDQYRERIVFPVRDWDGFLRGAQGRAIDPTVDLRYLTYTRHGTPAQDVLMGEHRLDFDRPVVVVEGPFDLARVMQVYDNACAVMTAQLNKAKARRLRWARDIVTLLDKGEAGDAGRETIRKNLPRARVRDAILPVKDPGDMLAEDLADVLENFVYVGEIIL